jgi:hypothetical protein
MYTIALCNAPSQNPAGAGTAAAAALPVLHSKRLLSTRRPSAAFDGGLWDNGQWTDGQPLVQSDSPSQNEHPEVDDDETGPPAVRRLRFRGASSNASELRYAALAYTTILTYTACSVSAIVFVVA